MSPSHLATSQCGWGFHTLRGDIDPGDRHFRLRVAGVVDMWRELSSGDETLSSLGAAEPRRRLEEQPSPRPGSISLISLATSQWGWGFHSRRGGIDSGDLCFRQRVVGVEEILRDFSSGEQKLPIRVRRDLNFGQRGNPRRTLAPQASSNQQPASGAGVSTHCGAALTRAISVFVRGLLELKRY